MQPRMLAAGTVSAAPAPRRRRARPGHQAGERGPAGRHPPPAALHVQLPARVAGLARLLGRAHGVRRRGGRRCRWRSRSARCGGTRSSRMCAFAFVWAIWGLDVYMQKTAQHWGQHEVIAAYYDDRASPEEGLVAYQMNWKGENFYTGNHIPAFVSTGSTFTTWLKKQRDAGVKVMYFITEHGRIGGLKSEVARQVVPRSHRQDALQQVRPGPRGAAARPPHPCRGWRIAITRCGTKLNGDSFRAALCSRRSSPCPSPSKPSTATRPTSASSTSCSSSSSSSVSSSARRRSRPGGRTRCKSTLDRVLPVGPRGHRPAQRGRRPRGLHARGRQGHTPDRLQGGVEEPLRGGLEAHRASTRSTAARARRTSLQVLVEEMLSGVEHGVRDVRGAGVRRGRGHRGVRHRRAEEALLPAHVRRAVGGHDVPDRAAGRQRRRQREDRRDRATPTAATASAAPRSSSRAATTTWPRTSSTSCSRASTARPPGPRGSRSSSSPRSASNADGTLGGPNDVQRREHRAQDGHQRLGDVRAQLRRRRQMHRLARRRRREAEPGHAADVQADEQRAHRRRHPGAQRRVERVPERARVRARSASRARASRTGRTPTAPRVPIIEHADVRRMLLDMKARVEGIRALAVKLAHHHGLRARRWRARTRRRSPTTRARSTCSCRS